MEFQDTVKELENTIEFQDWRNEHPDAYLSHVFVMLDDANKDLYQIGYYDAQADTVSTFVVGGEHVEVIADQQIAKASSGVEALDISLVVHSAKEILDAAEEVRAEHYGKVPVLKSFFVIQVLGDMQIYNVTYLTQDFKTINVKLAMDLSIVSHDVKAIADFVTGQE